jgi:restriction system protein
MAIPDYQTLMLPVLNALRISKERTSSEIAEELSNILKLSDEERALRIPSGVDTVIKNRVAWALTYLLKAGLLIRPSRGKYSISELGEKALNSKPEKIDNKYLSKYDSFNQFIKGPVLDKSDLYYGDIKTSDVNLEKTPEDLIKDAFEKFERTTKDEILDYILKSSPQFFERLILDLFQAMGYGGRGGDTNHVGRSGDGGIDGIINEDPLGLEKIYLQAKRYSPDNKISIEQIRAFAGSLLDKRARKGIFVTTSCFVASAYEYANNSTYSIVLIDGEELTRLMYEYDVGVRTVQTIKLKKPDMDYFEEL